MIKTILVGALSLLIPLTISYGIGWVCELLNPDKKWGKNMGTSKVYYRIIHGLVFLFLLSGTVMFLYAVGSVVLHKLN